MMELNFGSSLGSCGAGVGVTVFTFILNICHAELACPQPVCSKLALGLWALGFQHLNRLRQDPETPKQIWSKRVQGDIGLVIPTNYG